MISQIYRKYISKEVRDKIYDAFLGSVLRFCRGFVENVKAKVIFLLQWMLPKTENNRKWAFMGRYGLTPLPYPFFLEYKKMKVDCFFDNQLELYFVIHSGKKLYFPKSYKKSEIVDNYRRLIAEQDSRSPHQYVSDINRLTGKTLLDIGAAEAIFTLSAIEIINHAYIFECEDIWHDSLKATFDPWKDKVTIISKYVSDKNDEQNITIDCFLEDKDKRNLFLKMDIEGNEQAALRGAANTLAEAKDLDFSVCTYHSKEDATEIADILHSYGFECEQTENYLYYDKEFRKAIIRKLNSNKI
jgi:hypothetical protein